MSETPSDLSLRHAISLHPRPFFLANHHGSNLGRVDSSSHKSFREQSPADHAHPRRQMSTLNSDLTSASSKNDSAPFAPTNSAGTYELESLNSGDGHNGKSTSYEVAAPEPDAHDPVARQNAGQRESFEAQDELERQSGAKYTIQNDPLQLSSGLKSPSEIDDLLKAESKWNKESTRSSQSSFGLGILHRGREVLRARKVQGFYDSQNENIERLLKPVDDHVREAKDTYGENQFRFKLAVRGSFVANVLLAGLQLYGAASSASLSLFTTMADALFDPMSNITLMLSNRAVNRVDPRKFPSGKARIETAGNIVFCFLMMSVSFIIIVQSIEELVKGSSSDTKKFHLPSVIAVSVAFCTKLSLFLYCYALRNMFSQIRILWEDHRNDLLINGFGLLTSIGGSKLKWWLDPMGAIILSCLIVALWMRTAYSEFQLLIGVSADTQMLQLITYICMFGRSISRGAGFADI